MRSVNRPALAALVAVLLALLFDAGLSSWAAHLLPERTLEQESAGFVLFVLALVLLSVARLPDRVAFGLVIVVGLLLVASMITGHPQSSDDDFRYIWDGKVQLAGIDPYRYPPSAPQLAHLRDSLLFPHRALPIAKHCAWPLPDACSAINRPYDRTIYPPVAEGMFTLIRLVTLGGHGNHVPLQVAGGLGVLAVTLLLTRRARRSGRPAWTVAVWAWCPITWIELVANGHIDWLAALLSVLALSAYGARRYWWAGLLLGAAVATKVYPALIGAAMLRRRPLTVIVASVGLVVLVYVPHVIAVGTDVIGYLPGYLSEESYGSGGRFLLFDGVPGTLAEVLAVLAVAAVAVVVVLRTDPDRPEEGALLMTAATFAFATPAQGWYAALLIALVAMTGRVWALPVAFAPTVVYLIDGDFGRDALRDSSVFRAGLVLSLLLAVAYYRRAGRGPRAAGTAAAHPGPVPR